MSLLLGVLGDPVLHSRSPQMFRAAFDAVGLDAHYLRLSAASADAGLTLARELGLAGLNVTAPFKQELALDDVDPVATSVGAVNTVVWSGGRSVGYLTDPDGVRGALRDVDPTSARILVLGAGGAARSAVEAVRGARDVVVWNRTPSRARSLAADMGIRWAETLPAADDVDVVIHAVSFDGQVMPPTWWGARHTLLDATYALQTASVRDARAVGARILQGSDWLLYQGAASFERFTGQPAPLAAMRRGVDAVAPERRGNLALVGMMGAGKSTVARALNWPGEVIDVDAEVERRCGAPIPQIFRERGEAYFRAVEADVVGQLRDARQTLLVCGGGSVLDPTSREVLRQHSTVVWLWASAGELARRTHASDRPLLASGAPVAALLTQRMNAYADVADLVVGSQPTPSAVTERINREIHHAGLAPR